MAMKLVIIGLGSVGTLTGVIMGPVSTASKSEALTVFSRSKLELFQRLSGVPDMNMADPLSARMIPYFLSAVRMNRSSAGNPVISKLALRRRRSPMGGALGSVVVEAQWVAGKMKARWEVGTVKRIA